MSSNLPHLSYIPWIEVLIQTCRQTIFVSLLETGLASFIMEAYSLHVSRQLDLISRYVIPLDFAIMWMVNILVATSDTGYIFGPEVNNAQAFEDRLAVLDALTWVNTALLLVGRRRV